MNIKPIVFFVSVSFGLTCFAEINETTQINTNGVNTNVLIKHTFSAGGGQMSGTNYTIISSIGQIDAGHITTGGGKQFIGGILAAPRNNELFKNGFE